jgi:hypothetical protein
MALRIVTSCRMHASGFSGIATRHVADGISPSGIGTADDRRRLGVRPVIDHDGRRSTAAKGAGRRKTRGGGRRGAVEDARPGVNRMSPDAGSAFIPGRGFSRARQQQPWVSDIVGF